MKGLSLVRRVFQAGFFYWGFSMLLPAFYCPYRIPWIACNGCSYYWCPAKQLRNSFIYLIAGSAVVSGRLFCGWICPFGTIQDIVNIISRAYSRSRDFLVRDRPYTKYVVLAVVLAISLQVSGILNFSLSRFPYTFSYMPIVLGLALLASAFVSRLWCRFLCPLGAVISPLNKISPIALKINEDCVDCSLCKKPCVMVNDDKRVNPDSTDCTRCIECISACPKRKAVGLRLRL